jgi:glutaconate CoA-transferase subunit A
MEDSTMPEADQNKIMTTQEAIRRFVNDGDHLVIGNYTVGTCYNQVAEIVRQRKKGLTIYSQSGVFDVEMLIAGDCVSRVVSTYCLRSGGRSGGSMLERYQRAGKIEVEDYSNFTYNARLTAGAQGYSFLPVLPGIIASDVFKVRDFMGDGKFGVVKCPFTGREVPVVPAANPDVCIVHVQRADKFGNAQYWGALGSVAWACLASKRVIVSCEEIVDHEIIKASPQFTIVPAFRVDAVIEEPRGAHPAELSGYYNLDILFWAMMDLSNRSEEGFRTWMKEWVYDLPTRAAYLEHYISRFGKEPLDRIQAKPYYSAPVNYGSAFISMWDDEGKIRTFDMTRTEFDKFLEERGLLTDVS